MLDIEEANEKKTTDLPDQSEFSEGVYAEYRKKLSNYFGKVNNYKTRSLPKEQSERQARINDYVNELVFIYNRYIKYTAKHYERFDLSGQNIINNQISSYRLNILSALVILGLKTDLPEDKFGLLEITEIFDKDYEEGAGVQQILFSQSHKDIGTVDSEAGPSDLDKRPNGIEPIENIVLTDNSTINLHSNLNMAPPADQGDSMANNNQETAEVRFYKLCTSSLNQNFSGDPLILKSFVSKIKILKRLGPNHLDLLKEVVISKLDGEALEVISARPATVDQVIEELESAIKPLHSTVIEGRMTSLKFNVNKTNEFIEQAEELATALQRTLVIEGCSKEKASEMVMKQTIAMCKEASNKTEYIRSVLDSTTFRDPRDCIATFVLKTTTDKNERQILSMRANQNNNNGRGNFNRGRGQYNQRGRGQNNGNYYNQNYNRNNNGYNNNYNNNWNQNYRGNYRGRGRGRGRGYQNNQRNVFYTENQQAPPSGAAVVQVHQAGNAN